MPGDRSLQLRVRRRITGCGTIGVGFNSANCASPVPFAGITGEAASTPAAGGRSASPATGAALSHCCGNRRATDWAAERLSLRSAVDASRRSDSRSCRRAGSEKHIRA